MSAEVAQVFARVGGEDIDGVAVDGSKHVPVRMPSRGEREDDVAVREREDDVAVREREDDVAVCERA